MGSPCELRPVAERAFAYAHEQLWLARGLESGLREVLDPPDWDVWTLADPAIPASRLEQFAVGGPVCARDAARRGLLEAVAAAMDEGTVWLVPDAMARPTDAPVVEATSERIAAGDAVYYVERSADPARLWAAWRAGSSATGQVALVTKTEDLDRAAAAARLVVMTAYDGDGELFFERRLPAVTGAG